MPRGSGLGLDCRKELYEEEPMDVDIKIAANKASQSVVTIVTHNVPGSGAILECEDMSDATYDTAILTIATLFVRGHGIDAHDIKVDVYVSDGKLYEGKLFACDFHYNLAVVKIQSDSPLQTATLRGLDDVLPINSDLDKNLFQLPLHSSLFKICPGTKIISLSHSFTHPYDLQIAFGNFWKYLRPWLGMKVANLHAARFDFLEQFVKLFPNISTGVLVTQVAEGSPAYCSGIRCKDVIIECDGRLVRSNLQNVWNNAGKPMKLCVVRASTACQLNLRIDVVETASDNIYKWQLSPWKSTLPGIGKTRPERKRKCVSYGKC